MKSHISEKILREFGLVIGFLFPLIIGCILPFIGGHAFKFWTLWVGIPSLILSIMRPGILIYPYIGWMKLGDVLGWLNSRIILGLVFIFILQPISLIMRIFGHDPLRTKKLTQKSYREVIKNKKVNLKKIF